MPEQDDNESMGLRSVVLDLAFDLLSEVIDVEKDVLVGFVEGRLNISNAARQSIIELATKRECNGIAFEVVEDPHVGYHLLIKLLTNLNSRLSKFMEWHMPAGVRIDKAGVRHVINKFGEPISPACYTDDGVKNFLKSLVF